jgi:hypothetical protein
MTPIEAPRVSPAELSGAPDEREGSNSIEAIDGHELSQALFAESLGQRHAFGRRHARKPLTLFFLEPFRQFALHGASVTVPEPGDRNRDQLSAYTLHARDGATLQRTRMM